MNISLVVKLIREALLITLYVSAPILGVSLVIGLIVSIFQTTTSIQEQTLTFVPKFIGIFLAIIFFSTFIFTTLVNYTKNLFLSFPGVLR